MRFHAVGASRGLGRLRLVGIIGSVGALSWRIPVVGGTRSALQEQAFQPLLNQLRQCRINPLILVAPHPHAETLRRSPVSCRTAAGAVDGNGCNREAVDS
jgi:hypothetical protein